MSSGISGSRIGQVYLPPIVFEGKRYEQVRNGALFGHKQRTGLMAVFDNQSGARLGLVQIYETPVDPDLEADVQDVFFTAFEMVPGKREILIRNERDEAYVYSVDDGSVRRL